MGVTFFVKGSDGGPSWEARYGWAHLHRALQMFAAEEAIDLSSMEGYGGSTEWTDSTSHLLPLLSLRFAEADTFSPADCAGIEPRLRQIYDRWSAGLFREATEPEMAADQVETLHRLLAILRICIETNRPMRIAD